jgi:hypothetical protein
LAQKDDASQTEDAMDARRDPLLDVVSPTQVDVVIDTDIPARLDRLPWGRFHTLVVTAL